MGDITAVGTEAYKFFLQKVALIEWSPERIVQAAQQVREALFYMNDICLYVYAWFQIFHTLR